MFERIENDSLIGSFVDFMCIFEQGSSFQGYFFDSCMIEDSTTACYYAYKELKSPENIIRTNRLFFVRN